LRCWPNSEIESFRIEKLFDKGDEAFVCCELLLKTGGKFRNTEFFRVSDGKIVEVDVYFGRTTDEDEIQKRNRS
jgi:ketosteroid isomerase-like protein